jgi:acyl-CoA synthetase (AMP-forming)/AMP-acid ligase II
LQFTSGSTASPKCVTVGHANLMNNLGYIYECFEHDASSVAVTWLPVFHDMGLVGEMLGPIFGGFRCFAMPPHAFVQRPARWLRAITRYRATHSGGPNFAYDLCVDRVSPAEASTLDLGSWRVAYNGAEPIRVSTLTSFTERFADRGFRAASFHPCYGLAEATLKVTGNSAASVRHRVLDAERLERGEVVEVRADASRARWLASCGRPCADLSLAIVDPETRRLREPGSLGEIWLAGPSVAWGYYRDDEASERTFHATLAGEDPSSGRRYLRTGDLGFIVDGELYVAGRMKDLIILSGRNLYPQDIERSAESAHPSLEPGGTVAFPIDDGLRERLVVLVESARSAGGSTDDGPRDVALAVHRAVAREHQIDPDVVAIVSRGSLLKTSSGKIRRGACRAAFRSGDLAVLDAVELGAGELRP